MGDPGEATTWYQPTQTVWRPGKLLKKTVEGELLTFDERSFYQTNNDVTKALYKVKGYNHPVVIWFDNATGERLDRRSKQTKTAWTR
jgi:hypothetical protein